MAISFRDGLQPMLENIGGQRVIPRALAVGEQGALREAHLIEGLGRLAGTAEREVFGIGEGPQNALDHALPTADEMRGADMDAFSGGFRPVVAHQDGVAGGEPATHIGFPIGGFPAVISWRSSAHFSMTSSSWSTSFSSIRSWIACSHFS